MCLGGKNKLLLWGGGGGGRGVCVPRSFLGTEKLLSVYVHFADIQYCIVQYGACSL